MERVHWYVFWSFLRKDHSQPFLLQNIRFFTQQVKRYIKAVKRCQGKGCTYNPTDIFFFHSPDMNGPISFSQYQRYSMPFSWIFLRLFLEISLNNFKLLLLSPWPRNIYRDVSKRTGFNICRWVEGRGNGGVVMATQVYFI